MDWFRRFFMGRYGTDQLSIAMLVTYIVLIMLSYLPYCWFLSWVGFLLFAAILFRMFSRNMPKRYRENQIFLKYWNKIKYRFTGMKAQFSDRKTHRYFTCPGCHQKLRVPKHKGRIKIRCPKCQYQFVKKT